MIQGQAPLGSDPAPAQQHRGGVGPGSSSLQILGFCKPAVFRVETQEQARLGSDPAAPQSAPHDLSQQLHGGLAQAPLCSDPAALRSAPPHDLSLVRDGGVEPGSSSPELWRSYAVPRSPDMTVSSTSIGSSLRGAAFKIVSLKDEEDEEEHQEQEAPTGPDLSRQQVGGGVSDNIVVALLMLRERMVTMKIILRILSLGNKILHAFALALSFSGAEEIDDLAYMDEWESV
ncbi:hypothetical protein LguiA_001834 [Lonicera macranthoides]